MNLEQASKYRFCGDTGVVSLSLCNTVDDRPLFEEGNNTPRGDHLEDVSDALDWVKHVRLFEQKKAVSKFGLPSVREARLLLDELRALRELLFGIYLGVAHSHQGAESNLHAVNELLKKLPPQTLESNGAVFTLVRTFSSFRAATLGLLLDDAVELLMSERLKRLRVCAAQGCGWLFLDMSKNGSRRWCEMGDCGNREKARRFYQKQKKSGA